MFFKTIKFKLTLWYVVILGIILSSFGLFLYFTLADSLHRGLDNKIKTMAEVIASSVRSPLGGGPNIADIDRIMTEHFGIRPLGRFVQVLDESGRVGDRSTNLRNVKIPISVQTLKEAARGRVTFETIKVMGKYPLRVVTLPIIENGRMVGIVQVGSSLEGVEEALHQLLLILLIAFPAALLVTSVGGLFLANKALRPVDEITQIARRIGSGDLSQRIRIKRVNDEIGRLASTFNEMIAKLEESFRQVKRFTADASHELKTPLTILRGEVEVGLKKKRDLGEYRRILASNLEEIDRMSRIVGDLLTLSRADMGEFKLEREEVDLSYLAREVWEDLQLLAQERGVLLQCMDDGFTQVEGDPLLLRQLILNLVENGVKYTPSGGEVELRVKGDREKGVVKIQVTDTGVGIDQQDLERVFDRFFRVDKARSRDTGGTGLGLSICKWIAQSHQGQIAAESELGKGSTFTVTIPLKD
ncbi:MAG: heavy metal sensor histidine kinase [Deltaproteobacteria bacterium]|nr:heavy metal sensor histidine kinase [Deltaproteobacteria bacterium]